MHILLLLDGAFMWLAKRLLWLTDFFGIDREAVVWFFTVIPSVLLVLVSTQFSVWKYGIVVSELFVVLPLMMLSTWGAIKELKELESSGIEQLALPNLWEFDPKQRLGVLLVMELLPIIYVMENPHSIAWLMVILPRGFQSYLLSNYDIGSGVRLRDLAKSGLKKVRQVFTPPVPGPVPAT
ncbi:MAG: hypothetical protein NUV80_00360 [Candidatus Berkelbacteria bacterium]|nr:hypothetical protein [Candidatus Berkelbacteria bacterium]MCR4307001.1 hypothetical protein [Candidatus Berkelbacteria bacterium]